jgi:membrane protein YdbS with pleckstrin-like domain
LARKLGLSTLKIYSAGESGGDIAIKGLPKDVAETQYAFLTKVINERL